MANALLDLSRKHGVVITQKYLEPGHTQMECDSVHSNIEQKLKNREIHLPSDYATLTKEIRKEQPYEVVQLDNDFVKDFANPKTWCYKSIRPGRKTGSISHHHGVGKLRKKWYTDTVSEPGKQLLLAAKKALDPDNIFALGNMAFDQYNTEVKSKL